MTRVDDRRPGVTAAGFAVTVALLLAVVFAYQVDVFTSWAGGEYAYLFLAVAIAAVVTGAGLQGVQRPSPWRPFGVGLLLGGSAGILFTVALVIVFWYALSNLTF
jgi:hypothetical protein